jgi:hypothetical protein
VVVELGERLAQAQDHSIMLVLPSWGCPFPSKQTGASERLFGWDRGSAADPHHVGDDAAVLGQPNAQQQRVWDTICRAYDAAFAQCSPGVPARQIHRAAAEVELEATGRNPRTGESVEVEEKWVPTFKTGKELRERLNSGKHD